MKVDGGGQNVVPSGPHQTTVVLAPQQPAAVYTPTNGCSCAIPPDAPEPVKQTRTLAIVVLSVHAVALLVLGFFNYFQWVGSICGIVAAAVLLCCYQKNCYTCAAITWIVAVVFDLVSAAVWFISSGYAWVGIFPIIALMATIPAIVFGFKACNGWVYPETANTAAVASVVNVVPNQRAAPPATVIHMPQGAPPAYGSSV